MNEKLLELIRETISTGQVFEKEAMKKHTTFKIGGDADLFVMPGSIKEAEEIIRLLRVNDEHFTVIGNGSNILVSDDGMKETVICFGRGMDTVTVNDTLIEAEAGTKLSSVARVAFEHSLTGLEFASGIPGSLGGGVYMNAGAYGGELKDVIEEVTLFDLRTCNSVTLPAGNMKFSYRHSIAKEEPYIILSAKIRLSHADSAGIKSMMDELNGKRREKQPLEYPSAGSTFKRPEGYFAGKLIEEAGLKGYTVGGAQVSEKHCGFVINRGNATGSDVRALMDDVINKVREKSGVTLEPEVVMLGFDR